METYRDRSPGSIHDTASMELLRPDPAPRCGPLARIGDRAARSARAIDTPPDPMVERGHNDPQECYVIDSASESGASSVYILQVIGGMKPIRFVSQRAAAGGSRARGRVGYGPER